MVALLIPAVPASSTLNLDIASASEVFGKFGGVLPIYTKSSTSAQRTLYTLDLAQNLRLMKIGKVLEGIALNSLDISGNCNLCELCTILDICKKRFGNRLTLEYNDTRIIVTIQQNCRFLCNH